MSKRKRPTNESAEQATERQLFEQVSNAANRSEKTSWLRKMDKMVRLLNEIQPIEEQILKLIEDTKKPLMEQISDVRRVMVVECIHPYDQLVVLDAEAGVVQCKFCNKKLRAN